MEKERTIQDIHTKKRKRTRIITILLVILLNLGIVTFIVVRELTSNKGGTSRLDVTNLNLWFLFFGIALFGVALFAEYMKYRRMILSSCGRLDKRGAFQVATYGKYADNVTPLGAGGQPFQIHFLHKRGYPGGASTSVTLNGFLSQQISFIVIAVTVLIVSPFTTTIPDEVLALKIMAYIGLGFYSFFPLLIIFFAIFPKPINAMLLGILKLGNKMHLVKNYESAHARAINGMNEYVVLIKQAIKKPTYLIPTMFWSFVYQFAILTIPFFAIMAFGGAVDWWTIFVITVYIYLAITIIPTPGNAGVAETSFFLVFSTLPAGALFWAMIYWRALVYYSWIIIGLIVVLKTTVRNSYMHKKEVPSDRPLNICLVLDTYFPIIDGVVRTVDQYAREMTKLGHKVLVVVPDLGGNDDSKLPYEVYRMPLMKLRSIPFDTVKPFMNRKIKKYFKSRNFDVIHCHSPMFLGMMMQRFGRKYKIPVFTTFHSKYYDDTINVTHSKLLAYLMVKIILHFYHRVDRVWACSASTAETLRSYGYNGHIGVMENGVEEMPRGNIEEYTKEAAELYRIPTDKRLFLFVGQQIWHKNLKLVLDTTKKLSESDNCYHTVIVGTGYDEDAIKQYAQDIGISDKVTFVGKIRSRKTLFGLYKLCDIFFFPSLYDNAPLVVREAALAELPSLLVAGSNAAEIIVDGENGYLADNNVESMTARIKQAYEDKNMKEIGKKAAETIPIPWKEIVQRVIERYILETEHPKKV